eukprot:10961685-Ditylum_brightwellii.AAC.1
MYTSYPSNSWLAYRSANVLTTKRKTLITKHHHRVYWTLPPGRDRRLGEPPRTRCCSRGGVPPSSRREKGRVQ